MAGHDAAGVSDHVTTDGAGPAALEADTIGLVDEATLQVARDALLRVNAALGEVVSAPSGDGELPPDRYRVARALQGAWDAVTARARALAAVQDERLVDLVDLLNVVRTADQVVGAGTVGGESVLRRIRERLAALAATESLVDTLGLVPRLVAELGFDRVLLSRVESSTWMPLHLYFKGDPRWADEILEAMRREPLPLDSSLLETQMVRHAVPLRVVNPAKRPLMNKLMITLSHTHGYVAAPIVDRGEVVGFVHADCYYQGRVPGQGDLDALWLFCEALGQLVGRQARDEQLAAVRHEAAAPPAGLGRASAGAEAGPGRPGRPVARPADPTDDPSHHTHALRDVVTPREAEVLALLTEGASNEQIARRLGISLGTAKSHLKRILRRLDVANRSEAASLWLRSEYGQEATGSRER